MPFKTVMMSLIKYGSNIPTRTQYLKKFNFLVAVGFGFLT